MKNNTCAEAAFNWSNLGCRSRVRAICRRTCGRQNSWCLSNGKYYELRSLYLPLSLAFFSFSLSLFYSDWLRINLIGRVMFVKVWITGVFFLFALSVLLIHSLFGFQFLMEIADSVIKYFSGNPCILLDFIPAAIIVKNFQFLNAWRCKSFESVLKIWVTLYYKQYGQY